MEKITNLRICLVTFLLNEAFISPLNNLESILSTVSENNLYVIEGCFKTLKTSENKKIRKYRVIHKQKENIVSRIIMLFYLQIRMSLQLIKLSPNMDLCIFFTGQWEILPLLTAKILNKKILWLLPSSIKKIMEYDENISPLVKYYIYIQKISFFLSDKIILYTPNLIKEWDLEKYNDKILFAYHHGIDLNKFKIEKKLKDREIVIGFIGRLSTEKGICNFLKSASELSVQRKLKFMIIGNGDKKDSIFNYITENNFKNIEVIGWVSRDNLSKYLNKFKLIVVPSYTEGLPNIIIESMACGTPVLASAVGSIPDIIKDCKNGFIMENNSSKTICKNIIRAINFLEENDQLNTRKFIKRNFQFERKVSIWKNVIMELYNE
ncbi:MAG: glycosyltransferase [Methanobacteriaceae archaeon]|nr:glycosyltransferase [Methanobacteriaceae archaeon]